MILLHTAFICKYKNIGEKNLKLPPSQPSKFRNLNMQYVEHLMMNGLHFMRLQAKQATRQCNILITAPPPP